MLKHGVTSQSAFLSPPVSPRTLMSFGSPILHTHGHRWISLMRCFLVSHYTTPSLKNGKTFTAILVGLCFFLIPYIPYLLPISSNFIIFRHWHHPGVIPKKGPHPHHLRTRTNHRRSHAPWEACPRSPKKEWTGYRPPDRVHPRYPLVNIQKTIENGHL